MLEATMQAEVPPSEQLERPMFSPIFLQWLAEQLYTRLRQRLLRHRARRDLELLDALWMVLLFQARSRERGGKVSTIMNAIIGDVVGDGSWVMGDVMEWSEMEEIYGQN